MMDTHNEVNNNTVRGGGGGGGRKGLVTTEGIVVTGEEEWLCVSRLPTDVDDDEFYDMLAEFGSVKESFLVYSSSKPGETAVLRRTPYSSIRGSSVRYKS